MSKEAKHTPVPWHYERWYGAEGSQDEEWQIKDEMEWGEEYRATAVLKVREKPIISINAKNGETIVNCHDLATITKANADFIVKACNNHYELLEVLEECLEYLEGCYDADYQGEETGYIPNDAMCIGGRVEEVINKAKRNKK